jgi:predicted metal-binding protein
MRYTLLLFYTCYALQHLVLALAAPGAKSFVRHVKDEASFVAALKDGVQVIVVKQHLDLFCDRSLESYSGQGDCPPNALPFEQMVAASTRAIVVRFSSKCF